MLNPASFEEGGEALGMGEGAPSSGAHTSLVLSSAASENDCRVEKYVEIKIGFVAASERGTPSWPIARKDQLDSHEIFVAATLDPSVSSVLIPSGALRNFLFFSPFGKYLGGARFTSFSVRQCLNMKDL